MAHIHHLVVLTTVTAFAVSAQVRLTYPVPPKSNQVDDLHGSKVSDPYRSLEDADAPATQKFVEQENELTFGWLAKIPGREAIRNKLAGLWNYEKFTGLYKAGKYFYRLNSGLQNQAVLYVTDALNATPRVLLDPNTYRKDGTAALANESVSWNGKLFGYAVAQAGSDWDEWRVRDVATGKDLPDLIRWSKGYSISWAVDDSGFYYSRFPEPPADKLLTAAALNHKIYFHKLGDPQTTDRLVYERPRDPAWTLAADVMEGSRYVLFDMQPGEPGKNMLAFQDVTATVPRTVNLMPAPDYSYNPVAIVGSLLYVQTTSQAPRGRVVAIDLAHPSPANWKEIVPQQEDTLDGVQIADGKMLLSYMKDAHAAARIVTLEGKLISEVAMPGLGSATWGPVRLRDKEAFYTFTGYTQPPAEYRLDLATGQSSQVRPGKNTFRPADYETKQIFYKSKDGTRVPMFLSYRKGLKTDGNNPTILYAYGGFDIAVTPSYSPAIAAWMEMGGVYAVANLRGGSEYGEAWHQAGMRARKQNVFDDFIGAGEWLIANKYTSTPKLAVFGGSNGGLLVGAVLNQRPDLFGAAMPAVGVMDMLRFHKFGFGTQWVGEYGSPDNAEDFKVLRTYSPLHNIRNGTKYPATLITTADHDDRVMPGHSLKYAATLQQAQAGPAPILLRVDTRSGHGAGKPTSKQIEEWADRFTFLKQALGMTLPQ
jgi:prolyl oligopeptidase